MPVLDFKEIPEPNKANGRQDTFELFARDFLEYMGYKPISGPDRGQDGGRDLIVMEVRKGVGGESSVKWLVSCKHKAHSGNSISISDESDIRDRIEAFDCNGFIGFYSTITSSSLSRKLGRLTQYFDVQILDNEKIENNLLKSSKGLKIAKRYFPQSLKKWCIENPKASDIFCEHQKLECLYCGKNLLEGKPSGIIVVWETIPEERDEKTEIVDVYWCCKGNCDRALSNSRKRRGTVDGWKDISDIAIPTVYLKWILATFNELRSGIVYKDETSKKFRDFMYSLFPYISRELTESEKERVKNLMMFDLI